MDYVLRAVPQSIDLTIYSGRIIKDTLSWYRHHPDGYRVPVYEPPPGRNAHGLSISIGHAVNRARYRGTVPCLDKMRTLPVVYSKKTYTLGDEGVAMHQRYGDWSFPKPEVYGAQIVDDLRSEILTEIAGVPPRLDFVELTLFRDEVLSRPDFAGTDDRGVLHAILARLQDLSLVGVQDVDFQGRVVKALRLTPMGWKALEPAGEAA